MEVFRRFIVSLRLFTLSVSGVREFVVVSETLAGDEELLFVNISLVQLNRLAPRSSDVISGSGGGTIGGVVLAAVLLDEVVFTGGVTSSDSVLLSQLVFLMLTSV